MILPLTRIIFSAFFLCLIGYDILNKGDAQNEKWFVIASIVCTAPLCVLNALEPGPGNVAHILLAVFWGFYTVVEITHLSSME